MDIFTKIESKKIQFILSFISATIYQLGFNIILESCNFTVYFLSYIRYKQTWVDMNYGNLMRPVVLLFLAIFSPLSGAMEHFFGPRISVIISSLVVEIGFVLLYFQRNLWHFYLLTLLLGIGSGLSTQILLKNACFFYPDKKGLISALIFSIGTLLGSSYAFLGELVINPDRAPIIGPDEPYYEEKIAEQSKNFFLFAMIIIPVSTMLSLLLLYKYSPECEINSEKIESAIKGPILEGENEEKKGYQNTNNPKEKASHSFSKPIDKEYIKKSLKKWRFWRNILIMGLMPFMIWFESATSRPYSSILRVDGKIIGILAGSMSILGCITNPIWAFCVDKFGFQPIAIIISSLTIILSIYFCIFMDKKIFYVIGLYISSILRGGIISSYIPHIMQIFGLKYFLIIGGIGRLFTQLLSFSAGVVSIVISIFIKGEKLSFPYRVVSIISCGFAIFGLILSFYENDDKFKFDEEEGNIETEMGEENKVNKREEKEDEKKFL